jgi:hypothetical protein
MKTVRKNLKTRRLSRKSRAMKRPLKNKSRTLKTKTRRVLASVYMPGSDNFTSAAKRLTRKGGYTKWQVKTQTLGIGSLRKSKLTQFGYHTDLSKTERAAALSKAIKEYGALSVYRSLNALAVYNKNTHPEVAKHAKEDRDMIRAKFF